MANGNQATEVPAGWMSDVQRAIALILIGTFALLCVASTIASLCFTTPPPALVDMVKTLQAALVNMSLIALGFFFGNTMAKMAQDKGQQDVVNKLTSTPPGTLPPIPGGGVPVPPWWTRLKDDEKSAITAASAGDPRVAAFVTASQVGAANADDLAYLVTKGLLTQERADTIKTP